MLKHLRESIDKSQADLQCFENYSTIQESLKKIDEVASEIDLVDSEIRGFSADYDFDEKSPGNGYRSYGDIVEKAAGKLVKIVENSKNSNIFLQGHHEK
jgi:hypothetical protein